MIGSQFLSLLEDINSQVSTLNDEFSIIIINDASTENRPEFSPDLNNLKSIQIINMKENKGHARCNASGVKYINKKENFDYVILMDGDGEDRPQEIKDLINEISIHPETSVVAKRIKRSEGPIFQLMYQIHKLVTYLFTGEKINFGNYSCLTKPDIKRMSNKASLWSSYSGTFKKNIENYNEVKSIRGMRYFGPSQMSLFKLLIHSFSIIAVFKYRVFTLSLIYLTLLNYLGLLIKFNFLFFQIVIILFNILIFIVSFREDKKKQENSQLDIANEEQVTH